jgi:hypothetical protein
MASHRENAMKVVTIVLAAVATLVATAAFADGEVQKLMTAADKARLEAYGETRKAALEEAKGGDPAEVKELDEVLGRNIVSFSNQDLTGKWQCRTIKAGGLGMLVIYDWFKCEVSDDGSGWMLKKTTGSQRTTGRLYDDGEKRAIYLGSLHYNDDPVKPYGTDPEMDQVGYAFRTGPNGWRIEFPKPVHESVLNIIELRR